MTALEHSTQLDGEAFSDLCTVVHIDFTLLCQFGQECYSAVNFFMVASPVCFQVQCLKGHCTVNFLESDLRSMIYHWNQNQDQKESSFQKKERPFCSREETTTLDECDSLSAPS